MYGFLMVGLGGAIGACMRYATGLGFAGLGSSGAAYATLSVNLVGSFLLGTLSATSLGRAATAPESALWLLLGVGIMGSFTTFSAFSRETFQMLVEGAFIRAGLYMAANLLGAVGAFCAGMMIVRRFVS
ncbi:MAG: fluoride efflux transporter FluC [Henriciella sp.]